MRPQQNRRMRGRGNSNRKGPNPLTRSYESNGPDVKIRGTAQQVAEKYAALARDAQSSGDRVMAENYLQHAEHYNRLIAAAQAQNQQSRPREDEDEDRDVQDAVSGAEDRGQQESNTGSGPQPVIEGTPAEVAHEQGQFEGKKGAKASSRGAKANGSAEHEQRAEAEAEASEEAEQPQRRPRRARRPRAKSGEGEAEAGAADAGSDSEMADAVNN
jgi:hypothetical protein